ncbi:MAG: molybdate ABC transporter substrate-binding protein [Thermoanaerobacteraceae bacterium]|nr:molybdate ABC transporter substrate-binding protein [Thermoanaerobacteraceae bacterium]
MLAAVVMAMAMASALLGGCAGRPERGGEGVATAREIRVFAGSASKPPLEEIAARFEARTGTRVTLTFGGSGAVLSQMKLSKQGDIYLPGSSDFMELAKKEGVVLPETERIVVYLVPAINVPKGNPQGIQGLEDLAKPGVKVGMARPDTVCVGLYGAEILEKAGLDSEVKENIVTYVESCEKVANLVALGQVDAVLGWEVFSSWNPDKIETIYLPPEKVSRIGYIPVAVSSYSTQRDLAQQFIDYLTSEEGKVVFKKWGYLTTEEEARRLAPQAPVGGEYRLQKPW